MSSSLQIGFYKLQGAKTITITASEAWEVITIYVSGMGKVTITGVTNRLVGGESCGSIELEAGAVRTYGKKGLHLNNLVIAAEAGALAEIQVESYPPNN